MLVLSGGRSAKWQDEAKTSLRLMATFESLGEIEYLAVRGASAISDQILDAALAGKFGAVADYVPPAPVFDPAAVSAECSRRIYAVASVNAVNNINLYLGSGAANDADRASAQLALKWISDMRDVCRACIAAQDFTFTSDARWPVCPPAVVAFAERF